MAMPTLAEAKAWESLIPSPTMATLRPFFWRSSMNFALVVGHHRGLEMFDPGLGSNVGRSPFPSRR